MDTGEVRNCETFKEGKRNGMCIEVDSNGDVYQCTYVNDKKNGHGFVEFKDGRTYLGGFEDDKYHD